MPPLVVGVLLWGAVGGGVLARPATALVPTPPTVARDVRAVDDTGRFVVLAEDSFADAVWRLDRVTGAVSPLPAATVVSSDGSAVITRDLRWVDVASGSSVPVPERADFTRFDLTADGRTYVAGGPDGTFAWVVDGASQARTRAPVVGFPRTISASGRHVVLTVCGPVPGVPGCDEVRWDRSTGRWSTVARASAHEVVVSDVADTGRVIVARYEGDGFPILLVRDVGGVERSLGRAPGLGGGTLSRDGGTYGFSYTFTSCCWAYATVEPDTGRWFGVTAGSRLGGRGPVPASPRLSGDGATVVWLEDTVSNSEPGQASRRVRAVAVPGRDVSPRIAPGEAHAVPVSGVGAVPVDATAAMLTVTVTNPAAAGFVTVWPCGRTRPGASSVNFAAGQTVANTVLASIGDGGRVCVASNVAVNVVVDVGGWFGPASGHHPVGPLRIVDTRLGRSDGPSAPGVAAGLTWFASLPGSGGVGGVGSDATAVMLNVTVTNPAADGYLTVWPCGHPPPLASNVNFRAGQTVANAVLAELGDGGNVCFSSNVGLDAVVDVDAWFDASSSYAPIVPARLVDTRRRDVGAVPKVAALTPVDIAVAGETAVLNVTVTNPAADGFLTVWPCGEERPLASNVNFAQGRTVAGLAVVRVGANGRVCAASNVAVDLIVDLQGTFVAGSPYRAVTPFRLLDTRA